MVLLSLPNRLLLQDLLLRLGTNKLSTLQLVHRVTHRHTTLQVVLLNLPTVALSLPSRLLVLVSLLSRLLVVLSLPSRRGCAG